MKSLALRVVARFVAALWVLLGVLAPQVACSAEIEYFALEDPSATGIGFVSNEGELYVGGCRVFEIARKAFAPHCRYPSNTRWGVLSPDGSLLLATVVDARGSRARSFQIEASSGRVLSSSNGMHFAPPVAIHPSGNYWVSVRAGRTDEASETLVLTNRKWRVLKDSIYANAKRIYSLEFVKGGNELLVNGGVAVDGAALDSATWQVKRDGGSTSPFGAVQVSADGRFGVKLDGKRVLVIGMSSGDTVAVAELDASTGEPEAAFSRDGRWAAAKGYYESNGQRQYGFALISLSSSVRQ